jgi:hypothetical protein
VEFIENLVRDGPYGKKQKLRNGRFVASAAARDLCRQSDVNNHNGWHPQRFATLPSPHKRYDPKPTIGTPEANGDLPKWIMHLMPDVRLCGVVTRSRLKRVVPYVKFPWSQQPTSARAE